VDQVNANENKFGYRRLESLLLGHAHLPMEEQKKLLLEELKQFQADEEQRDDITLVGIKLKA
jgi:serine phosphatase RsbU (regulator of sigma subunit)